MKTPQQGRRPAQQELMEFVDGTLPPDRFREVEQLVSQSRRLQSEVRLLQAMRRTVYEDRSVTVSKKFTAGVMSEVLPVRQDSLWLRLAKNSSNLFAMVLVLSMIGIVLVSGPGKTQNNSNIFSKTMESYTAAYESAQQNISGWTKQFIQPVDHATSTPSGKFLLIGLAAFIIVVIADEVLGKRFFQARIRH